MFCQDDIITGDDKLHVEYHLVFPRTFFGAWELVLRQGGPQGPEVCKIVKSGFSSEMLVVMPNGWKTPLVRGKLFSNSHEYIGFDGETTWKWKTSAMSRDITVSLPTAFVVKHFWANLGCFTTDSFFGVEKMASHCPLPTGLNRVSQ